MDQIRILACCAAFAGLALLSAPTFANDSEAEWALGGLVLKSSDAISMDREDLFISSEEVRVDYVYTNHSPEARDVLIAFPLPALPDPDSYYDYYGSPDWDQLEFETRVDGTLIDFEIADRALVGDRDVTALIAAEGFPLHWYREYDFTETLADLPEGERQRLIALGLLRAASPDSGMPVEPAWQVQRSIVRKQLFPANASVRVSHRYTPLTGGSVGGMLDPRMRADYPEGVAFYRDKWCTDASFLAGVDRRLAASPAGKVTYYSETWIGYVLKSGANWRGPIKDFRLVVDKGEPGNLVSFCMDGVKKISPTQFEVVKRDFEPARDLDILLLSFHQIED